MGQLRAVTIAPAISADAPEIHALRCAVADDLTAKFGHGPWSDYGTVLGTLRGIQTSMVLVARRDGVLLGKLRLTKRKPWAIDLRMYTPAHNPLYMVDVAVAPAAQGRGLGTRLVLAAEDLARNLRSSAMRLDAYDSPAGAAGFYCKAGYDEVSRGTYRGTKMIYFEKLL